MKLSSARGTIAVVAAIGVAALTSVTPSFAADKIRAVSSAGICFCFLPARFAADLGIWKKYGLEVEVTSLAGDAKVQQALASDSADIGLAGGPGLGLVSKGVPAKSVAAIVYGPGGMSLIVPENSPYKSPADLRGKRIGVTTGGSLTDWLARRVAQSEGFSKNELQIVPLGDLNSINAGMRSGAVDAFVYGAEAGYGMQVKGNGRVLLTFDKMVPEFIAHLILATDKFREKNPEQVRKFLAGWFETVRYMKSHRDETITYAEKTLELPPGVGALMYDAVVPQMSDDGQYPPKALEVLEESFVELGILPKKIDVNAVIDRQYLPK